MSVRRHGGMGMRRGLRVPRSVAPLDPPALTEENGLLFFGAAHPDYVTLVDGDVSYWTRLAGGHDFDQVTASIRGAYNPNGANGKPCIDFAADDYMRCASGAHADFSIGTGNAMNYFVVKRPAVPASNDPSLGALAPRPFGAEAPCLWARLAGSDKLQMVYDRAGSNAYTASTASIPDDQWCVLGFGIDQSGMGEAIYVVDGVQERLSTSLAASHGASNDPAVIHAWGNSWSSGNDTPNQTAAVAYYRRDAAEGFSEAEINQTIADLESYYGIS